MFNYDEFKSAIKQDGLAKQNRFYIELAMPALSGESAILFGDAGANNRNLHMFCKSVNLPGVNVTTVSQRETGETFEIPYDRNFSGVTLSFYVDRNLYVRKFFDDWVNSIQNPETRVMGYYKDFVSSALTICVLDKQDRVNYIVVLYDVHPKQVGTLSLDQGSNETMTLDVTLEYHYYRTFIVPQSSTSPAGSTVPQSQLMTTGVGEPYMPQPQKLGLNNIVQSTLPNLSDVVKGGGSINPLESVKKVSSSVTSAAQQFQNTIGSVFGTIKNAISGYQNDFLSFQRQISSGLGVLNSVTADIRNIVNAPKDALNSAKSTVRDISSGIKNAKNAFKIF
jgi:hypothetical protein